MQRGQGAKGGNSLSLSGSRLWEERDLQIGLTCFLLTSARLQYLHNQLMMNRPDQQACWLVKQVASRLQRRWRGAKKCLFWNRLKSITFVVHFNSAVARVLHYKSMPTRTMQWWRQMMIPSWYFISSITMRAYLSDCLINAFYKSSDTHCVTWEGSYSFSNNHWLAGASQCICLDSLLHLPYLYFMVWFLSASIRPQRRLPVLNNAP